MIGLGGQLGLNALGAFELGTIQTGSTFVPHRGRARSAITARRVSSRLTAPSKARSEVSDG